MWNNRKSQQNSTPIDLMRQFYSDYNRIAFKRSLKHKNCETSNFPQMMKTSSVFKMTSILNQHMKITTALTKHRPIRQISNIDIKSSQIQNKLFNKKLEEYRESKKGFFKNEFNKDHDLIRPFLFVRQKQIPKSQERTLELMKDFHQCREVHHPLNNKKQLEGIKKKLEDRKKVRKQITDNLRYNNLLNTKYQPQIQIQQPRLNIKTNSVSQFLRTKENIFPSKND